jgi:transposase-like protein
MTPATDPERYKNHRFPGEIISHGVWLYYRFPLSYRDVYLQRSQFELLKNPYVLYDGAPLRSV